MREKRKKTKNKKIKRSRVFGLNLIIWFSFLLFSVILILIFTLLNSHLMISQYRQREEENLSEAGSLLKRMLLGREEDDVLNGILLSIANQYSINAYLFRTEGDSVLIYPEVGSSYTEEYKRIYQMVDEQFQNVNDSSRDQVRITFSSKNDAGYATIIDLGKEECYLYLTSSFEHFNIMLRETRWLSLIMAIFALTLSVVISGFVSMVITKPVTSVTERAKAMARGEYDESFQKGYFCTELNDLSQALDYASSEISKSDRIQKELIANVSHDFKTPLTMIKAYASMIQEISGDDPIKRQKHTQIIIDEADRLAALVADVLDLSRLQAGVDSCESSVFNLSEEVYLVAGRFDYLTELYGYQIVIDIDEDLYTYAEKERTEQVLYNLIGNAVNYTGDDKQVKILLKKREGGSHFEVSDTGKGIPPEQINTIWERYYRSTESHKRPVKGTGLGLAIVKSVLLKQGIPFGVESKVGEGTCFWVDFPDPPDLNENSES